MFKHRTVIYTENIFIEVVSSLERQAWWKPV